MTYKTIKHDFHNYKIINEANKECYGLFNRFDYEKLIKITDKLNQFESELSPIREVCRKYNIPIADLPAVLDEYIVRDNDGYYGYSMCNDCENQCGESIPDCTKFKSKL